MTSTWAIRRTFASNSASSHRKHNFKWLLYVKGQLTMQFKIDPLLPMMGRRAFVTAASIRTSLRSFLLLRNLLELLPEFVFASENRAELVKAR